MILIIIIIITIKLFLVFMSLKKMNHLLKIVKTDEIWWLWFILK